MSIIELDASNCQNCYKCIRECPIKAIKFRHGKARIIDNECILCGHCVLSCPQNAKYIKDDVKNVKELIKDGHKVFASIAPSWVGWYESHEFAKISASLKKLGFAGVEETAIGARESSREYAALLKNAQMKNIIVTACSSVVMLIERHFPHLVKMLAPVSSPMMAHARLIRESYGSCKVVFIGPCLSKKFEAQDPLAGGLVNYSITFSDIDDWLKQENIEMEEDDSLVVGIDTPVSRAYPKPTGIIKTISEDSFGHYKAISVDGISRCIELFSSLDSEEGLFIEANICSGGCIGGPIMRINKKSLLRSETKITIEAMSHDVLPAESSKLEFTHPRVFANRSSKLNMPSEEEIKDILAKIGKFTPEQELNCSSCGYTSCRAKAIAVYQGKADINMCLPFFRERAENMSNMVTQHSPNGIIAFDSDLLVQELNPRAEILLNISRSEAVGNLIPAFYGELGFEESRKSKLPIEKKITLRDDVTVEQTIIYIKEHDMYLAFIKDVSDDEIHKNQLEDMRYHTIEVAQKVIDKQMRVAQEIASLLGETTGETKVALSNLKKSMTDITSEK